MKNLLLLSVTVITCGGESHAAVTPIAGASAAVIAVQKNDFAQRRRTIGGSGRQAPRNESKTQAELNRILEYPAADRIKRLRFFIKSNPNSSLIARAKQAINAALVENGEAPTEEIPTNDVAANPSSAAATEEGKEASPETETRKESAAPTEETTTAAKETTTAAAQDEPAAVEPLSPATERRLKSELSRILEYPAADRIKRLRFFIKSNPSSEHKATAQTELDKAINEGGNENSVAAAAAASDAAPETPRPAAAAEEAVNESAGKEAKTENDAPETTTAATTATVTAPSTAAESSDSTATPEAAAPAAVTDNGNGAAPATTTSGGASAVSGELSAILERPLEDRIAGLQELLKTERFDSPQGLAATDWLVAALAESGDAKLKAGDVSGGIERFRHAVEAAPPAMSEKLYAGVVANIPTNLYLRGQLEAAREAARAVEAKVSEDARRLLPLAAFYLSVEQAGDAARVAARSVALAPDMAAAHQTLGAAYHINLQLEKAAEEYGRALELDPKSSAARRSLADLRRANGKSAAALPLYRELLGAEPKDLAARAGVVLSLYETDQTEEADKELAAALKDEPRNLSLLSGAAYWFAAQGDAARAAELAEKAVTVEPRYTWAQIAFARARLLQNRPLEAERALRFARQYGNFPTLDYELATALAAAGLYGEAVEELTRSFAWKNDSLETRLANTQTAAGENFVDLLAPERRAGIFQARAADTEANARMIKSLFALHQTLAAKGGARKQEAVAQAARDFVAGGSDNQRSLRALYAAELLIEKGAAPEEAAALADAAMVGVDAALDSPRATVAVLAAELRTVRARAIAAGGTPDLPELPREVLDKIVRGRIEAAGGWALFNQQKAADASVRLRRAISVLPENSQWWKTTQWRLGFALEASGSQEEALNAYIKGYRSGLNDAGRRAVIEALYRRINGSLSGLDARLREG